MGSGAWLRLLLALAALWGTRARETQLGTLGAPTLLQVPQELRNRTREFGEASWKKITEEPLKKKFLLKISGGNHTEFEPGRLRFHRRSFSLEILNTSRDDGRLYEYSVYKGEEEEVWQIQLEVLEPVADPSIRILRRESSNGSCWLELSCSSERGDEVSYSWDSWDGRAGGAGGLCRANGSVLALSFPLRSAAFGCVCTARNRVSSARAAFDTARCGAWHGGVPGVRTELLVPLVVLGVIIVIIIVMVIVAVVTRRATRSAKHGPEPSQVTPDTAQAAPASATIYAQVQRVQKPKGTVPSATPVSCTTIYAAATGPPPAPNGAPRSPAGSPAPRGCPPLSQEPTTVYASMTLPVA